MRPDKKNKFNAPDTPATPSVEGVNTKDLTRFKPLFPLIKRQDYISFVKLYVYMAGQGQVMLFPTGLEFEIVYPKWKGILDELEEPYDDEFARLLTEFWIEVLSQHGGEVTPRFIYEMIKIIEEFELIIRHTIYKLPI